MATTEAAPYPRTDGSQPCVSGIWGGTTHLARRQMRQNYGIAAIDPATGLDKLLGVSA